MLIVDNYKIYALKEGDKRAQIDALDLSETRLPYIRVIKDTRPKRDKYGFLYAGKPIPFSIDGEDFKELCLEIGYFDTTTMELESGEIKIGHVVIENIDYWEYTNPEGEKGYCYKFYLKGEDDGTSIYEHDGSIKTFIINPLCKINKDLDAGKQFKDLNLDYFKECVRDRDWDIHHKYFNPYNSVLSMVYNCNMERKETFHSPYGSCYGITIDIQSPYMYNPYIFWLLSQTISELKFQSKGKERRYIGLIKELPEYIKKELELGEIIYPDYRNYIELQILSSIVLNFNEDYCRNGWESLSPNWEQTEYKKPHISSNLYNQYCIFRNMKCWHYIDGQYRVGRDDTEWDEDTYSVPVIAGSKIMDEVLSAINKTLKINLSYQAENNRYYCCVCGESEYIAGMAKRRGGPINNDNTVFQFLKVMLETGI